MTDPQAQRLAALEAENRTLRNVAVTLQERAESAEQAVQALREALEHLATRHEWHAHFEAPCVCPAHVKARELLASSGARVSTEHEKTDGSLGFTGRGKS